MSASDELWIGIDVGTQSVKVSVVDGAGALRAAAGSPLHSIREKHAGGDRHEQDPQQWISATREALGDALQGIGPSEKSQIGGMAVCSTSGSITLVDAEGRPVSTGIMYDDARAGELSAEVAAADPGLWARLGYRIQPTWALPKILWLERNRLLDSAPETPHYVAHQADVVASALVGHRVASDWSHSLKSGYDLLEEHWPTLALQHLGIDPEVLPVVVPPGTVLGNTSSSLTATTGVPTGVPVFAGMTDGCAAQLGAGAIGLGDWHTVIGTTMVMKSVSTQLVFDDAGAVYSHRSPEAARWLPGGASNVGAGILTTLFPGAQLDELTSAVAARYDHRTADLPFSYPLPGVGERFPVVAPQARGFVSSNGQDHPIDEAIEHLGQTAAYAAILVGVACVERLALEQLARAGAATTGTISSSGGGTRNAWWVQLRADLIGREITVSSTADGSTGMAILAAWAGQSQPEVPLASIASTMSHSEITYRPNAERSVELETVYRTFLAAVTNRGWIAP
ncbi:FGGY-family carbohydrate kinase [Subtercola boreus]|uniref:Carbohydrate kinase n=1 Tax=Subtercola boreus TaxID=120213 RepID=A0A3E0WC64_9MICO|nr:FGGY family carbohydrate kinase [Subtercola boreus]RFA20827.1 hypothetical protein B7R24_08670 [Subtercola boreus]RFA20942.1 hypothetical protein B7R23_08610 [Subtercola boreus]RFA27135.1 hypothetical protein B7R25_08735 [Subtercola boreus]